MTTALLISLVVFVAAVLRGLTGFGFALAAVPGMSLFLTPAQAVVVAILLQCWIGLRDTIMMRRLIARRAIALMSAGAVIGTPLGTLALTRLAPDAMRVVLAGVVALGLAALMAKVKLRPGAGSATGAGLIAGLFSGLAAMPGPPAIAYFLGTDTPARNTRASLMVFFFITSLLTLPGLLLAREIDGRMVLLSVTALPALLIGTWAGGKAFARLDDTGYRRAAIGLLALTAALSAWRGLAGLF